MDDKRRDEKGDKTAILECRPSSYLDVWASVEPSGISPVTVWNIATMSFSPSLYCEYEGVRGGTRGYYEGEGGEIATGKNGSQIK